MTALSNRPFLSYLTSAIQSGIHGGVPVTALSSRPLLSCETIAYPSVVIESSGVWSFPRVFAEASNLSLDLSHWAFYAGEKEVGIIGIIKGPSTRHSSFLGPTTKWIYAAFSRCPYLSGEAGRSIVIGTPWE